MSVVKAAFFLSSCRFSLTVAKGIGCEKQESKLLFEKGNAASCDMQLPSRILLENLIKPKILSRIRIPILAEIIVRSL